MALAVHKINHPSDATGKWLDSVCMPVPEFVYHTLLTAATDKSIAVPAGATHAVITTDNVAPVFMKANAAASVPAGDVVDGTGSSALPAGYPVIYQLEPMSDTTVISTLHFISTGVPKVTISWWKYQ